jgi:hypothetical protein
VTLVQPSGSKPDADAVMHQYLHAVGASVGKEVSGMRMRCAKDLDYSGQGGVGAGAHVQGNRCQPYGVNPDHANHSRSHCAQEAPPCNGQLTTMVVFARWTWMRISGGADGSGSGGVDGAVKVTGTNASG